MWTPQLDTSLKEPRATVLIPGARVRYLAEIAEQGRAINAKIESQAEIADRAQRTGSRCATSATNPKRWPTLPAAHAVPPAPIE